MAGGRSAARLSKYHLASTSSSWLTGLVASWLVYRYSVLSNAPSAPFTCLVLLIAALGLMAWMQPWKGKGVLRWGHVTSKGIMLYASILVSTHYLRDAGPSRVMLCTTAGTALFPSLIAALARRPQRCVLGGLLIFAALVVIQSPVLVHPAPSLGGSGNGSNLHVPYHPPTRHHAERPERARSMGSVPGDAFFDNPLEFQPPTKHPQPAKKGRHIPLPDDTVTHHALRDDLAEEEAEMFGRPSARGLLSLDPSKEYGTASSTLMLHVPASLFAAGIMMSVATVGARPIVNLANVPGVKRRAPPRPEPPLVILVAAICSAPLAIYQYNTVPDVFLVPTPVYDLHHVDPMCGTHCSLMLALMGMVASVMVDAAPGVGLPVLPHPGTSLPAFLTSAGVMAILDPFLGHSLGMLPIIMCSALLGWAATVLTSWGPTPMARPVSKRRQATSNTPAWLLPLARTYDSAMVVVYTAVKHILSAEKQRRLFMFLCINGIFMLIEFLCGISNNSIGLMSDACHMLFDNASIAIGMYAAYMAQRPATSRYTYGFTRFEVLSGFANSIFLVFVALLIVLESVERMMDPPDMSTDNLMLVSVIGLIVNIVGLVSFHEAHLHGIGGDCPFHDHSKDGGCCGEDHGVASQMALSPVGDIVAMGAANGEVTLVDVDSGEQGGKLRGYPGGLLIWSADGMELECKDESLGLSVTWCMQTGEIIKGTPPKPLPAPGKGEDKSKAVVDHNMRAMFLHVLADTLGSVGVIVSTYLIEHYGWDWADPVAAVFISLLVISSVAPLLQQSAEVLLLRVPLAVEAELADALEEVLMLSGVHSYQQPHFWANTPNTFVGSLRVLTLPGARKQHILKEVQGILSRAGITVSCIQVENVNEEHLQDQVLTVGAMPYR